MLGDNIKRFMKKNGYTQKQLAMRAGCTQTAISRYINNEREPDIRTMENLSIALGVTVGELINYENCAADMRKSEIKEGEYTTKRFFCPNCDLLIKTELWNERYRFSIGTVLKTDEMPKYCPECGTKLKGESV